MTGAAARVPPFPGAVGITDLSAYTWEAVDGVHGGSPHVHLACTECYVVVAGSGRLQTLTTAGLRDVPLERGDVVWFTPGTIHRTVNDDGALHVVVVMQNGGLPEAGDAVMTFPPEHLADPAAYAAAASLAGEDGRASPERARARRDLAVEGFLELVRRTEAGDGEALRAFYRSAVALARPHLARWRVVLEEGAAREAERTREVLDALEAADPSHLDAARATRLAAPPSRTLGMCGLLAAYDPLRRALEAESAAP